MGVAVSAFAFQVTPAASLSGVEGVGVELGAVGVGWLVV